MIALQNTLEGQLWQIILDGYGYDCDTHLFLRGIRQEGILGWVKRRVENVESDLAFLKHIKGIPVWDETMLREILEARNEIALEGPIDLEKLEKILAAKRQEKREKKKTAGPQPQQPTRKNYMNRAEREEFMILAAMAGKLEEIIENWVNLNRPKDRIKWARMALAYLYKAMDDCVRGIPLDVIARAVREVGLCTIGVIEYHPTRRR